MADPSGLDDLEAELRRMEEELAALKGKKPEKKAEKKPAAPAPAAPEGEPKKRFGVKVPAFGKKKEKEEAPPEALRAYLAEHAGLPADAPTASAPARAADPAVARRHEAAYEPRFSGRWSRDGRTWVLAMPRAEPVVLRRILDRDGNVVSEEPAAPALAAGAPEPAPAAPAEPEGTKPLHALAERLGGRRKKGGLFRRKGEE